MPHRKVAPLWVVNAVAVEAPPATIRAIARRPDVDVVEQDVLVQRTDFAGTSAHRDTLAVPWNLQKIRVNTLWNEGINGAGVTVGIIDTGVDASHEDLAGKMASGGWFDAVNGSPTPYDDNGHGTHITGIICGGSLGGMPIGVAPGARYIAAKALDSYNRFYGSWVLMAGQWMADPNGDGNPSDAPAIINCSWSFDDVSTTYYRPMLQIWRAEGILPVFAAGNRGAGSYSVSPPASDPLVICVGATGSTDAVTDFSSRGPAPTLAPYNERLLPDIVAPGLSIRSAWPGGQYAYMSGTSMAAPHVAGTLALLKEADPTLNFDDAWYHLTATAVELGAPGPDNVYGYGRLDAYAAVRMPAGFVPVALTGVVRDGDGHPIRDAVVDASGTRVTSGVDGRFSIPHATSQPVSLTVDAPGFGPATLTATAGTDVTVVLVPRPEMTLLNGDGEHSDGWEMRGPSGGFLRTPDLNRTPGGTWSFQITSTGDGIGRFWVSPRVPVQSDGLATVTATYAWRAVGNADGRLVAIDWIDGFGNVLGTSFNTPFSPPTRGGPSDGRWRVAIQAFRAVPPAGTAAVRLQLGAIFPIGDTTSSFAFDDVSVDVVRSATATAVSGLVTADGVPVAGAVVGEHPFGQHFALTDDSGNYVLLLPSVPGPVSAWATGYQPASGSPTSNSLDASTVNFNLVKAGPDVASRSQRSALESIPDHDPGAGADGDLSTYWASPELYSASPDTPVWWQADLGAERTIQSAEVFWQSQPAVMRVSVSSDLVNWIPLAQGSGRGWQADATHVLTVFDMQQTRGRYVRVEDVQDSPNGPMGLWEVRLHVADEAVAGDTDGNGVVNMIDAILALRLAGGLNVASTVNMRGKVTPGGSNPGIGVVDATTILRRWLGL